MNSSNKRIFLITLKALVSLGLIAWIGKMVVARAQFDEIQARLTNLNWGWVAVAALAQMLAIACSVFRWDRLLRGQGILAPLKHLFGSFMIGRFFGAFTPGGWTGLSGYRIYDIAKHTGETTKAVTTVGVDMLLGQLAFGVVVIIGSFFGVRYIGLQGIALVDAGFVALIIAVLALLANPTWLRKLSSILPNAIVSKLQRAIDAVCAYHEHRGLLIQAFFLAIGTHACNNLIFVASARALNFELGMGEVFFVSAMQVLVTLVPASINGIGLREATAVTLYGKVGLSVAQATLIPVLGFAVEMAISAFGGLVLMLRPLDYQPAIQVQGSERVSERPGVQAVLDTFRNQTVESI